MQWFEHHLDVHGPARERWTAEDRKRADTLLETSPQARQLLDEASRIAALLDLVPVGKPSAALIGRIMEARPQAAGLRDLLRMLWPFGSPALPGAALSIAMLAGVWVGQTWDANETVATEQQAALIRVAFGSTSELDAWQ